MQVVGLLQPAGAWAQMIDRYGEHHNEVFQQNGQNDGLMQRGGNRDGGAIFGNEAFGATGSQIGNEPFGAAPIGGGIAILLAAGAGYALIQSKKNKQD